MTNAIARRPKRGNGEGTLYWDPGRSRYVAEVTIEGRRIRRTAKTKTEARRRLEQARAAAISGIPMGNRNLTVAEFLHWWLDTALPGTVSPRTEESYREIVSRYLEPRIGSHRLAKLAPAHVSGLVSGMESDGYAPNTQRLARSVLRRALKRAEQEGFVARNVAAIADGPRIPRSEGRTLTPEEARCLLEVAQSSRLEAAWVLMLALGLRRCEVLGLSWSDVDFDEATLRVRRSLTRVGGKLQLGETKTASSRRMLYLPSEVVEALRRHRARQAAERLAAGPMWQEAGFVISSEIGTPFDPDNLRHRLSALTRAAGLGHWSPHELRHSAASLLFAMGIPLKVVSETLGHSRISVTADTYAHLLAPAKREAAEVMGKVLWG